MRGGYLNLLSEVGAGRVADVIEQQKAKHKEDCERRLALIQNGKHPDYKNGHPKHAEKFGR